MMSNKVNYLYLSVFVLFLFACMGKPKASKQDVTKASKPNIIYILADDLGYGDLSCYGQDKFQTPNIDRLAERGMKFTQHYSGSTVCAPSRSALMTGEHTGHTPIRGNKEIGKEGQEPLPDAALTIAEVMKKGSYVTGAFGKWGLGFPGSEGDPNMQGFDEFFGYNCQRMAHRYYPAYLWHNQEKMYLEGNDWQKTVTYAQDEIQEAALNFIRTNKDTNFFAFIPIVLPHAELLVPDDEIFEKYKGKFEEMPYQGPKGADYGPDLEISKYSSQAMPKATFASMVSRIDKYVGEIVAALETLGLSENTIVMFASDNGPHEEGGANPEFFNSSGGLRGVKRDLYEGGVRSPFIISWPGTVEAGSESDHISAFWDVLPTFAELAHVSISTKTDGISFVPEMLGLEGQKQHTYLYWEFHERGGRQAVRLGKWKGVVYNVLNHNKRKLQLFNLEVDVSEQHDVADENPQIVAKIESILKEARTESDIFTFQLPTEIKK